MADKGRIFITAIFDTQVESFISASLQRQGFTVLYRGISAGLLVQYLQIENENERTLLISQDFLAAVRNILPRIPDNIQVITIHRDPLSDFEVAEMIRPIAKEVKATSTPLKNTTRLIGVTSIGSRVGASTVALNIARESALQGIDTLLVDSHYRSPFLADHFNIFGLNRGVHQLHERISILELQERIEIDDWISEFNRFELVIFDAGEICDLRSVLTGRRKGDQSLRWIAKQASELIVVSDEEVIQKAHPLQGWNEIRATPMKPALTFILNAVNISSRGEQARKNRIFHDLLRAEVTLISRDNKSFASMRSQGSTLAETSPKSRSRQEIVEFCRGRNWRTI